MSKNHTLGKKIKIKIKTLFPITKLFTAFLVKLLNIVPADQKNIYKCAVEEKIPQLYNIHLKVFSGPLVLTLAFFHVKHVHIF